MKPMIRIAALVAAATCAASALAQGAPAERKKTQAPIAAGKATPAPTAPKAAARDAEKESAGRLAAQVWLVLLDRRDWGSAWDVSSQVFRDTVPLSAWMDAIPKLREPYGALVERQPAETVYKTSLPGRPDGHYVSVIFLSKFQKKDRVEEVVTTVLEPDGKWRVTGYTAR